MNSMEEEAGLNLGGGKEKTDKDEPEKEGQPENNKYESPGSSFAPLQEHWNNDWIMQTDYYTGFNPHWNGIWEDTTYYRR